MVWFRTLGIQHWDTKFWAEANIKISIVGRVQDNSNTIHVPVTSSGYIAKRSLAEFVE